MTSTKIGKTLKIDGMSCQNCVKRVNKILSEDTSLENIQVDLEKAQASFTCNQATDIPGLITALAEYDFHASE